MISTDKDTSIFLTGGTGQLGASILMELLWKPVDTQVQYKVIAAKRSGSSFETARCVAELYGAPSNFLEQHPQILWIDLDLFDHIQVLEHLEEACAKRNWSLPLSIIHTAAVIDLAGGRGEKNRNAQLTEEVLSLAAALKAEHFTHISSIAVMGANVPLGHSLVLQPADFHPFRGSKELGNYAKSKMASELVVWRGKEEGLSVSVLRPGVIIGVGPASRAPQELWLRLWKNRLPFATDGMTGVVDVRDVAEAALRAHMKQLEGPFTLVGHNLRFDEMLRALSEGLGVKRTFKMFAEDPWLDRMRAWSFLRYIPGLNEFFSARMRSMLFSKLSYNGDSGASLLEKGYRSLHSSTEECGKIMRGQFQK